MVSEVVKLLQVELHKTEAQAEALRQAINVLKEPAAAPELLVKAPRRFRRHVPITCEWCRVQTRVKKKGTRFCSPRCRNTYYNLNVRKLREAGVAVPPTPIKPVVLLEGARK